MDENELKLTDQELKILYEIVKQHKITLTLDDLTKLTNGETFTPLISLTQKLVEVIETRQKELKTFEK